MCTLSSQFLSLAALRHHIDGGHCPVPPSDDPPLLWHHPLIISGLHGGTFDHLMAYKSLVRRLGYICGLCGHQSGSSASLLKHLGSQRNWSWQQATTYAEWLETDSALRNLGCSCLRPPSTAHVCTVFTQLALFAHHDLTKLQDGSDDLFMAHALRLDLQVLSPTISLSFPDLDSQLTTGHFEELPADDTLCTALSTWCCLRGRRIDPRDMLQRLWSQHAKHANRGSLFYKYLSMYQVKQQTRSICKCHPTAAQCPILLQLASLLAILHHGHGSQSSLRDVGCTEPLGQEDGGRRGEAECQEAPIHHVEWREEPGKRKRKKRTGEEPDHQWRVHAQYKQPAAGSEQVGAKARRHTTVPGHGDGLLRFFERGSRIHSPKHDDPDHNMASDSSKREDTPIEDPGSEIPAGRTAEEDTETSIHGLLRSLDPNVATPGISESRLGSGEQLCLSHD